MADPKIGRVLVARSIAAVIAVVLLAAGLNGHPAAAARGHAGRPHCHVVGYDLARLDEFAFWHAYKIVHAVAHGVHGVMTLVAVERPVAGSISDDIEDADGTDRNISCRLRTLRALGHPTAIGARHRELMTIRSICMVISSR